MRLSSNQAEMRRYLWRVVEVVSLLALVVLLCAAFAAAWPYIFPFVIGGVLAMVLLPLVRWCERIGMGRTIAVLTVMAGIVVLFLVIFTYLAIAIAREATTLTAQLPTYLAEAQKWARQRLEAGMDVYGQLPPQVSSGLQDAVNHVLKSVEGWFNNLASFILNSLTMLPEWTFLVVIALIATFFMLVRRERMYQRFLGVLPPGWSSKVQVVVNDVVRAFLGTIRVQVILMILSAVLGVLGMWLLNIPYALILGLLFGISGMIPILGSAIMTVPWAAGALLLGDVPLAIKVLLIQVVISSIRHLIEPKILADSVGLDTLSTLFALYVGMKLLGVLGLFVGPIALIGVKSLLRIRLFVDFLPPEAVQEADARAVVASGAAGGKADLPNVSIRAAQAEGADRRADEQERGERENGRGGKR
ncbi:sporulation integral membrane protein YtvI [Alicyclobacillus kakegawensis]|uniref:sporulation integral membrane protein YtvI n=1 Tax=Alicyclobacillus kakegawensis TaxID=392012 RepID=UPI0009FA7347|nr:sporulation integral membrane protein YtvI [Alicyclobacillus kakegawensis]